MRIILEISTSKFIRWNQNLGYLYDDIGLFTEWNDLIHPNLSSRDTETVIGCKT